MITRSYNADVLRSVGPEFLKEEFLPIWLGNPHNVMLIEDDNIGLATHEYKGLYSCHWFFKVRGREAVRLGRRMVAELFNNYGAETVRGFTPVDNKAARWASRQVGLKSYGIFENAKGKEHELFMMTKSEFKSKESETV